MPISGIASLESWRKRSAGPMTETRDHTLATTGLQGAPKTFVINPIIACAACLPVSNTSW